MTLVTWRYKADMQGVLRSELCSELFERLAPLDLMLREISFLMGDFDRLETRDERNSFLLEDWTEETDALLFLVTLVLLDFYPWKSTS